MGFGLPGPKVLGTNFSLLAAGQPVYASPHFEDYPYSKSHPNYSQPVLVNAPASIKVPSFGPASQLEFHFDNNDRNIQLLLPLVINVTCTSGPCAAPPPTKIACVGDSITQGYLSTGGMNYPNQLQVYLGHSGLQ